MDLLLYHVLSLRYSAVDSRSFRECEGKGFHAFVDAVLEIQRRHHAVLSARDILPCAKTVSEYVSIQANSIRRTMECRIKEITLSQGGSITLDGWTEEHTKTKFMGCTFHYLENYGLKEELLFISEYGCERSQSGELESTAKNITEDILKCKRSLQFSSLNIHRFQVLRFESLFSRSLPNLG